MITILAVTVGLPCGLYVASVLWGGHLLNRERARREAERAARKLRIVPK